MMTWFPLLPQPAVGTLNTRPRSWAVPVLERVGLLNYKPHLAGQREEQESRTNQSAFLCWASAPVSMPDHGTFQKPTLRQCLWSMRLSLQSLSRAALNQALPSPLLRAQLGATLPASQLCNAMAQGCARRATGARQSCTHSQDIRMERGRRLGTQVTRVYLCPYHSVSSTFHKLLLLLLDN